MPRRDGTGPMGSGAMTGGGLGFCSVANTTNLGFGLGLGLRCRQGFRRNMGYNFVGSKTQKELLIEQKEILERELEVINKQLDSISDVD